MTPEKRLLSGRVGALVVLVALFVLYLAGLLTVAQLVTLLVFAIIAVLVLTVRPAQVRALLDRVQEVSAGGVSIELAAAGAHAAAAAPTGFEDPGAAPAASIVELRFELERKLADLASGVLSEVVDGIVVPTHVTVGRLVHDRLLDHQEGLVADTIMTTSEQAFLLLPPVQRTALLHDGSRFVAGVRAAVFHERAAQVLRQRFGAVERVHRTGSARPDLVVVDAGERVRYVPVFSTAGADGEVVQRQLRQPAIPDGRTVVLLPSLGHVPAGPAPACVETFGDLLRDSAVTPPEAPGRP
ncbi:hypothetical protein ACFQ34_28405 [Pseudonocardia benzenivorans]|uniref:Uncharacterized protein n=2 Tax=Pseudonocardia TaxID=1847 RepID=F4D1T1_PSEUX|nr:hypothetical protein [Pseudonocardia dioxanivorans]AEA27991.1 hypothetical protein Psed_5867 [Pseudonocardia dioxanivorans CB1190]GJF06316.1 hypothetical protein PSD17_52640 [Pseudonocardia sp. D17]